MSTGTSLVHPDTAKLTPEEQKKGIYHYTPPEVLAYLNGENLTDEDLAIVEKHYGYLPDRPSARQVVSPVAQHSEPAPAHGGQPAYPESTPRRLVKKKPSDAVQAATMLDVALLASGALNNDAAWALLANLAKRFDLEIE